MSQEHTALAVIGPANMNELSQFARSVAVAGFGYKDADQALVCLMSGRDLGLTYSQSARAFHVIKGKATLSADAMVAVCLQRKDICRYFRVVESTDERCTVETHREGEPVPRSCTWTIETAKRAEVYGSDMYKKYPRNMLRARAKSELARDVYPDLLLGIYAPEEMMVEAEVVSTKAAPKAAPEAVEAEVIEPTPPTATANEFVAALQTIEVHAPDLDRFRAAKGKPPLASLTAEQRSQAFAAYLPGQPPRRAFDAWLAENPATARQPGEEG